VIAVKASLYALIAVVFGVLLIGILPSQIEGFTILRTASIPQTFEKSLANETSGLPPKGGIQSDSKTGNETAQSAATASNTSRSMENSSEALKAFPAYDLGYYSLWVVNLTVALLVYLFARKRLG